MLPMVAVAWAALQAQSSHAQEPARIALLIGNKDYVKAIGSLNNPLNDVDLMEAALKRVGFSVTALRNASARDMETAARRHADLLRRAGPGAIGFYYYSGHGAAHPDTQANYIVPLDVSDAGSDRFWYESIETSQLIDMLRTQAPRALHYVVFDACRNELALSGSNTKSVGGDNNKGFAPIAKVDGVLIAYATAPGKTASDLGEGGGAYAKTLADEVTRPNVEAVEMFRNVQLRMKEENGQDPWLSFPALPRVYLGGRTQDAQTGGAASASREWENVKSSTSVTALQGFLSRHRDDPVYGPLALERIEMLRRAQVAEVMKIEAEKRERGLRESESQRQALPKVLSIRRTGGFGGSGGDHFDDTDANPGARRITGFDVNVTRSPFDPSQHAIGRLRTLWSDTEGPPHGGGPAQVRAPAVRLAADEHVTRIRVYHRKFSWVAHETQPHWVAGLHIVTNKGAYTLGQVTSTSGECTVGKGEAIIALHGRSGSYIDQLGCVIARLGD
jgi:uncharacterized caspase-like protein